MIKLHFFTSVTINYLPKARILAKSVKHLCKDAKFSLVLCDILPVGVNLENEPFDEIVTVKQLNLPVENIDLWIFIHSQVELCTAVKGQALVDFLAMGSDKVVYLDPDIVVFDDLRELELLMDNHPVILTPHHTIPEKEKRAIVNNEICSLMHGVYNFGFFAVKNNDEGIIFAKWWRDRLVDFCFDDIPNGLFTDQRWGDLAPSFFEFVHILRKPNYNVATWNINTREVTRKGDVYFVNGHPLQFYHFSGFDSGGQEAMLKIYGNDNENLWDLRNWYIQRQDEEGQSIYGKLLYKYGVFSNGRPITQHHRLVLRLRADVYNYIVKTNPFDAENGVYYKWYNNPINEAELVGVVPNDYKNRCAELENQIEELKNSTSWKATAWLRGISRLLQRMWKNG